MDTTSTPTNHKRNQSTEMDNNNITTQSIFDGIRHFDGQGNEYWMARELMKVLGYVRWQSFTSVIEIAKENLETAVDNLENHIISRNTMVKRAQGGGSAMLDYKLSRLASYHIALACDSRGNNAVKAAKHYFAVKTHEAETVIPAQSEALRLAQMEMEKLKIQLAIATQQNQANQAALQSKQLDNSMLTMHGAPVVLALRGMSDQVVETEKKTVEVIDEKTGAKFEGMTLKQLKDYLAQRYGNKYKSGADIKRYLERHKADGLIAQIPRRVLAEYIPAEFVDEAVKILTSGSRQRLIGE